MELFPLGKKVRVRGIQVHGNSAELAVAGQRTALNLAGADTEDVSRGMTLAPIATFRLTRSVDVKLRLLSSAPRPVKSRTRVHFHCYTAETVAEIAFYATSEVSAKSAHSAGIEPPEYKSEIRPGEEMFAKLRLREAALLLPGDRFIIRQFSPVVTIGGGYVVANQAPSRVADAGLHFEYLRKASDPSRTVALGTLVTGSGVKGISIRDTVSRTGWAAAEINSIASEMERVERIGDIMIATKAREKLQELTLTDLEAFHRKNPLVPGMSKEELRGNLLGVAPEVFAKILDDLVKAKRVEIAGDLIRLPGRGVMMKDEEAESKKKIEDAFATAGLKVPALHEVLGGLKIDKARAQKIVTLLLRDRVLVKISDELVFHRSALEQLRGLIAARKAKSPVIDVAAFKEMTGVSRKYAIPLLEYLDRERVTKRVGDSRQIL
jgi:selenocysteine-specific elongation factor